MKVLGNLISVSRGTGQGSSVDKRDLPALRMLQGSGAVEPVEVFVLHWGVGVGPLQSPVSQGVKFHRLNPFGSGREWLRNQIATED